MPSLAINGVPLPVAADGGLKLRIDPVGSMQRNQRGHMVTELRRAKLGFDFELAPKPLNEAMMYRSLILGEGEYWNTISSIYGSKGLALSGTGSLNTGGGGNPISTNGCWRMTTTGQTLVVTGKLFDQAAVSPASSLLLGATLLGWRYDGSAYRIFAFSWRALDSVVTTKREMIGSFGSSGAPQTYSGAETLAVSGGAISITTAGAGGPWSWSNLYLLPWFLSDTSLVDALMTGWSTIGYPLPQLPRTYVTTDLVPDDQLKTTLGGNQESIACVGTVDSMEVVPLVRSGAYSKTDLRLSGSFVEV